MIRSKYWDMDANAVFQAYVSRLRSGDIACAVFVTALYILLFVIEENSKTMTAFFATAFFLLGLAVIFFFRRAINYFRFQGLSRILHQDCDPEKYLGVLTLLMKRDMKGKASSTLCLEMALACFWLGKPGEGIAYLRRVKFKQAVLPRELKRLNAYALYYKSVDDREQLRNVLDECKKRGAHLRDDSPIKTDLELMTKSIELYLTEGETYGKRKEQLALLYYDARTALQECSFLMQLAELEFDCGKHETAFRQFQQVASDANTLCIAQKASQYLMELEKQA